MFFRFLFLLTRERACSYLLSCSDTCIHVALKGGSLGSIHYVRIDCLLTSSSRPVCRKSIYRNSTANILNLDTQSQVSVVIFTHVFVRFLASLEGLQGQSYSFEQVTKQPAKPCPRAREEGRDLLTQSRRLLDGSKALPSAPSLPSSSGKSSAPVHREGTSSQERRVLAAWPTPVMRDKRAPGGVCVTAQVQSVVSKLPPPSLRYTCTGFKSFI